MKLYNSLEQAIKSEGVNMADVRTKPEWTYLAKGSSFQPQEEEYLDLKGAFLSAVEAIPQSDLNEVDFLLLHDFNVTYTMDMIGVSHFQSGKYVGKPHGIQVVSSTKDRTGNINNQFDSLPIDSKGHTHHVDLNAVLIGYAIVKPSS